MNDVPFETELAAERASDEPALVVDVEGFHEQLRALRELLLPALGLLLLGENIDVPAGQL